MPVPRYPRAHADLLLFAARERRNRWIGFSLSEAAVVTALLLLGRFGFAHRFPDPTVKLLIFILIFAAAAVAVALPIAFFRNDPNRWQRDSPKRNSPAALAVEAVVGLLRKRIRPKQ